MSRPLSEDEAALVARGLAEFKDTHRWERLGHKYLPHRCALTTFLASVPSVGPSR